jgi:hypothetical protein
LCVAFKEFSQAVSLLFATLAERSISVTANGLIGTTNVRMLEPPQVVTPGRKSEGQEGVAVTGLRYLKKEVRKQRGKHVVRTRREETRRLRAGAEMATRIHDRRYHKIYVVSSIK